MSYVVLARKYRPRRFSDVVGQPHVTRTLLNGLLQKRLAHAYLLSGPRGVGKTTTARLLARAINCTNPNEGEPCGVCERCTATLEGRALDVVEIDAASNNGVENIRDLRENVAYAPITGGAKVYIIDEVHMLSNAAFNALLKTLEEPPDHAYFCLATTSPQKVPSTILSRCQRFDFRRVSAAEIAAHLSNILTSEGLPFDLSALDIIARKADGSVRDSLSLMDQVIAFAGGQVMRQDAIDVAGDLRLDLYFRAVSLIESHSLSDAFDLDEELASAGVDPQDYLVGLEEHIVTLLKIKAMGVEKTDVPIDLKAEYASMGERVNEGDLTRLLQLCLVAETDVRRNFNARTRMQLLLVKFASFERSVVLADLISKLEHAPAAPSPAPAPRVTAAPVAQTAPSPVQRPTTRPAPVTPVAAPAPALPPPPTGDAAEVLRKAQDSWETICEKLAENFNSRARLIKHGGFPVYYSNGTLRINFAGSSHLEAGRALGAGLKEEYAAVIGTVSLDLQIGPLPNMTQAPAAVDDDPAVKLLKDRLGARQV